MFSEPAVTVRCAAEEREGMEVFFEVETHLNFISTLMRNRLHRIAKNRSP